MEERQYAKIHRLTMTNRNKIQLTGVKDMVSFDMDEVLMETEQGMLLIKGSDMKVGRLSLDKGEVDIDGTVDTMIYSEVTSYAQKGKSFLKRLVK